MSEPALTGGCVCGAVRFEISEPLVSAIYCHCNRCQRRTGSAFSANGITRPGSLTITQGADEVTTYDPGDGGWLKRFCSRCGAHLYTAPRDDPASAGVRLGALDQDPGVRPSAHQFVAYAASWEPIPDDGLPRYQERRPAG